MTVTMAPQESTEAPGELTVDGAVAMSLMPLTAIEAAAWTSSSVPMASIDSALLAEVEHLFRALVVSTIHRVSGYSRPDI